MDKTFWILISSKLEYMADLMENWQLAQAASQICHTFQEKGSKSASLSPLSMGHLLGGVSCQANRRHFWLCPYSVLNIDSLSVPGELNWLPSIQALHDTSGSHCPQRPTVNMMCQGGQLETMGIVWRCSCYSTSADSHHVEIEGQMIFKKCKIPNILIFKYWQ